MYDVNDLKLYMSSSSELTLVVVVHWFWFDLWFSWQCEEVWV